MTNINYIGVLDYLFHNQEISFIDPESTKLDDETKKKYLLMQQQGQCIVDELNKIARKVGTTFGMKHIFAESWLD